jgi:DNA anti-recombination protein RmuC
VKKLIAVAFVLFALAAVPTALAGSGHRVQRREARIAQIAERFHKRCGTSSAGAPQRCADFANKALQRLQAIDTRVEQKMTAHPKLQKIDADLKTLIGSLQTWLGSTH